MSKGKKQACTLIILCVLMAAAICLYLFMPKGEAGVSGEDGTSEETVNVVSIDADTITTLKITGEGREEISLEKDGENWKLTDLPDAPIAAETVEGMFTHLSPVTATKALGTDRAELSEYGLDTPQMVVKVGTSDGKEYELQFGQTVPVTGGNYGTSSDDGNIYTFADTLYSSFDVAKNSLITKEEIEEINDDYLTSISVRKDGEDTFRAEVVPDEKKVDAYTNWVISKPYKKPLAGSLTEDWTTLQGFFTAVSFGEMAEYGAKDLAKYGLDKTDTSVSVTYFNVKDGYEIPQETASPEGTSQANKNTNKANEVPDKYKDNKSYRILFGKKTDEGDYYVRLDGSRNVYTMSASEAENMLGVDAYTYMDHSVYATLATDLKGYDVTIGKKKISVTHTTEKDGDGNEKNVWTLNGKNVPESQEEAFLTPYSKAFLLEFTSSAKESKAGKKDGNPVITIVYHEKDRDVTVKYLPYDGTNFYRVDKDGMDYFLVDKRSVDDMAAAFESLSDLDLS